MDNKEILRGFADNTLLFTAVRELLLSQFNADELTEVMTNEKLGEHLRARMVGREKVEKAFREISQYSSTPKLVEKPNPGK